MSCLSEQVALVTGSARGIGLTIARILAQAGAKVVVSDLARDAVDEAVRQLTGDGLPAVGGVCNVTDEDSVNSLIDGVVKEQGRLDILVNNAGITRDTLALRMKTEQWRQVLDTNLTGAFLCSRAAARHMLKARQGRIINISSVVGLIGNEGQCNYSASKAGMIGLTRSLAKELASRTVTVNAVAPGYIATAMTDALPAKVREAATALIPLGAFGTPEDIAAAVRFLASPDAAYITGQVLSVDGGRGIA